MKSVERKMLSLFYELASGENRIEELAKAVGVSLTTVKRYASAFESADIAHIKNINGKNVISCSDICFVIVKINEKSTELSAKMISAKQIYSVSLPYNEALTQEDNAICIKRMCEKLCADIRAEKKLVGVIISRGSYIGASVCKDIFSDIAVSIVEDNIFIPDNTKARDTVVGDDISALVFDMIKNMRNKRRN